MVQTQSNKRSRLYSYWQKESRSLTGRQGIQAVPEIIKRPRGRKVGREMKVYKTQTEVEADIVKGTLMLFGPVYFSCDIKIAADIVINGPFYAFDVDAIDIYAHNIFAQNIDANHIRYDTFCIAQESIVCRSVKSNQDEHLPAVVLGGVIELRGCAKTLNPNAQ